MVWCKYDGCSVEEVLFQKFGRDMWRLSIQERSFLTILFSFEEALILKVLGVLERSCTFRLYLFGYLQCSRTRVLDNLVDHSRSVAPESLGRGNLAAPSRLTALENLCNGAPSTLSAKRIKLHVRGFFSRD